MASTDPIAFKGTKFGYELFRGPLLIGYIFFDPHGSVVLESEPNVFYDMHDLEDIKEHMLKMYEMQEIE